MSLLSRWTKLSLVALVALGLQASGCATSSPRTTDTTSAKTPDSRPQAGTERWSGGALALTEGAPIVGVARLDQLFRGARGLRGWLIDEPAMFGDSGRALVHRFRSFWQTINGRLGFDLLSDRTPAKLGIDASRPMYAGLYPASAGSGDAFVEAIRSTVRDRLELEASDDLLESLRSIRDGEASTPEGLNAEILRSVRSIRPYAGIRVVVPLSDATRFAERTSELAKLVGYSSMEVPQRPDSPDSKRSSAPTLRAFRDLDRDWPGFVMRVEDDRAVLDVLFRAFRSRSGERSEEARIESLQTQLRELFEQFEAGRPAAPRPPGKPALALSVDQREAAQYARLEGFRRVLERLARSDVARRDTVLVRGLVDALRVGRNLEVASRQLTGASYALDGPSTREAGHLVELSMTLFGRRSDEKLSVPVSPVELGIDRRGMGASLALGSILSPQWRTWLDIENVPEMLDYSRARAFQPMLFNLALPRNLALLAFNVQVGDQLPDSLATFYRERAHLRHLEVATADDLRSLQQRSAWVALLSLEPGTGSEVRRHITDALPSVLGAMLSMRTEVDAGALERLETDRWSEGELTELALDERTVPPIHYFVHDSDRRPFVLLTYGLERERARRELTGVLEGREASGGARVASVRLEPASLVGALTRFDSDAYGPLDLGILAQRIGPLVLTFRPERRGRVQRLRWEFDIRPPPDL